jgi:hypothetical protein
MALKKTPKKGTRVCETVNASRDGYWREHFDPDGRHSRGQRPRGAPRCGVVIAGGAGHVRVRWSDGSEDTPISIRDLRRNNHKNGLARSRRRR